MDVLAEGFQVLNFLSKFPVYCIPSISPGWKESDVTKLEGAFNSIMVSVVEMFHSPVAH